jgi:hypothetical protein
VRGMGQKPVYKPHGLWSSIHILNPLAPLGYHGFFFDTLAVKIEGCPRSRF